MDNLVWAEREIRELKERVKRLEEFQEQEIVATYEKEWGVKAHARRDISGAIIVEACCSHCIHE